ncbi:MAG: hypothetical protein QOH76_2406 [Thermoleophilaceae bacterium]|nr:hypothetical protein [Thermoleophilaceae bacterium]
MTARFWISVRRTTGIALALLILIPAAASAASFQRVGQAPGGDDLAVIKGVPHVAFAAADGVHVSKLTSGNVWQPVGGTIRHTGGAVVGSPSLTSDPNGVPWVVWTEVDSSDTAQARVARYVNGSWQEVVGGARPINASQNPPDVPDSAFDPQIAIFGRRPYVAYIQDTVAEFTLDAVRLSADGSKWEHIAPPQISRPADPRIAVSGGHLYLAAEALFGPDIFFFRLNDAGTAWDEVGDPSGYQILGDLADVGGAPVLGYFGNPADESPLGLRAQVLGANEQWSQLDSAAATANGDEIFEPESVAGAGSVPYVSALAGPDESHRVIVSRFAGGAWEALASPSDAGADATNAVLAPGSTGGVWLLFGQSSNGTTTYYLDTLGAKLPADNPGGPVPSGLCANVVNGTAFSDRLFGTRRSDGIFGRNGNDTIRGRGASDCLYGGNGKDVLYGDRGNDFFRGGAGSDRIYGGPGNDDINGDRGNDRIYGGNGNEAIDAGRGNDVVDIARHGTDVVECGRGRDTAVISLEDGYRNCERVIVRR